MNLLSKTPQMPKVQIWTNMQKKMWNKITYDIIAKFLLTKFEQKGRMTRQSQREEICFQFLAGTQYIFNNFSLTGRKIFYQRGMKRPRGETSRERNVEGQND